MPKKGKWPLPYEEVKWTGWEERGPNCPNCGSSNVEEIDRSPRLDDTIVVGQRHCKDCGFKGRPYIY